METCFMSWSKFNKTELSKGRKDIKEEEVTEKYDRKSTVRAIVCGSCSLTLISCEEEDKHVLKNNITNTNRKR